MFKTARFKIHNPSNHKQAMLRYALTHYHLTLKRTIEQALALPDLAQQISRKYGKGRERPTYFATSKLLYTLAPKNWALAPLRDYLVGDAAAMLMSHFQKETKGKNKSNPPTVRALQPYTETEAEEAYRIFAGTIEFPLKPQQEEKIEKARRQGHTRVAARLTRMYQSWAASRAAGELLRSLEEPLPRPIEFTRPEFERGFLLARRGDNLYLLVRLFARHHHYWKQTELEEGFVNLRTGEAIAGRKYPGLILPLEFGRDFHEAEYLRNGRPQSAKLLLKRNDADLEEFFVHVGFEFTPPEVETVAFLGIDRGAVKIGAATLVDKDTHVLAVDLNLEGQAFSGEMARYRCRIAEAQRRARKRPRLFRVRGRRADIMIGEYANRLVAKATEYRAQIVVEKINAPSMATFLTQSQFRKLHAALAYKAERQGLPAPIEVPAFRTSQTCARCGHWDRENRPRKDAAGKPLQDVFRCLACGFAANADSNASEVIALRGLHQSLKGGRFRKFNEFQAWLQKLRGRDSQPVARQEGP